MICKSCMKNVATIKFTEVVDGKAVQHFLCPECYKAQQEASSGFSQSVPKPSVRGAVREKGDAAERTKRPNAGLQHDPEAGLESATVGCGCYTPSARKSNPCWRAATGRFPPGQDVRCNDELLRTSKDISQAPLMRHMIKRTTKRPRLRDESPAGLLPCGRSTHGTPLICRCG